MQRLPNKTRILHSYRIIKPHPLDQIVAVLDRRLLSENIVHRAADEPENSKGNQCH